MPVAIGSMVYESSVYGPLFIGTVERTFSSGRRAHRLRLDDTIMCGKFELQTILVWSGGRWCNRLHDNARYIIIAPPSFVCHISGET